MRSCLLALVLLWSMLSLASGAEEIPAAAEFLGVEGPLGSATNPVRCHLPSGQRAYLRRLIDPEGNRATFLRRGSVGVSPYGNMLDLYEVTIGAQILDVHFDMYHEDFVEQVPLPGLQLLD